MMQARERKGDYSSVAQAGYEVCKSLVQVKHRCLAMIRFLKLSTIIILLKFHGYLLRK